MPDLVVALRRRWRLWIAGAVVGAMAGMAFSAASPPPHRAAAILLLEQPGGSNKRQAMVTDAQLVESRVVAQAVIEDLGLDLSSRELVDQGQPRILSDDLLRIEVAGPNDREAVRRTEALARSFLAFRRNEIRRQSQVAIQNLEDRERQLSTEMVEVTAAINARAGVREEGEVRLVGDLLVRRASLNEKLGSVRQRIEASTFDTDSITEASRVVDPAVAESRSPLRVTVFNALAGLILALLLTGGFVILQEATTTRLRRREEIAAALGAPIMAEMRRLRGRLWGQRRRFRKELAHPSPELVRTVTHICQCLERSSTGKLSLVLISVDSDNAAALALAATALRLLEDGKSVLLVDLTRRNVLGRLTKARPDGSDRLPLVGSAAPLWVNFPSHQLPQLDQIGPQDLHRELMARVDAVLGLASVHPAVGLSHLVSITGRGVVVATAGGSSATRLRSVPQLSEAAGIQLTSTILVGPDADDESVGLFGARISRRTRVSGAYSPEPEAQSEGRT